MAKVAYTFKTAYEQLRACDQPKVKEEIMGFLGVTTAMAWSKRIRGLVMPTVEEYNGIIEIFQKYGIKKTKVWEEILQEE
jgi:hypothetical protein